jgi:predicted metallo-beta-lactamase superfamily hydrolase
LYSRRLRTARPAQPAQPAKRAEKTAKEERDNSAAITAFVHISRYRRAVISRYIDSIQLSCRDIEAVILEEAVVLCNNCNTQVACRQAERKEQEKEAKQEAGVERVGSRQAV